MTYQELIKRVIEQSHFAGDWHEPSYQRQATSVVTGEGCTVPVHVYTLVHHFGVDGTELASCVVTPKDNIKKSISRRCAHAIDPSKSLGEATERPMFSSGCRVAEITMMMNTKS